MPATFSLTASDYKSLERAVLARFQRQQGRLNVAWFSQVFAWMFVTLAVVTFFNVRQRTPELSEAFGMILVFAVLGFLFASVRPWAGQWLYKKYVAASDFSFTAPQSVDVQNGMLVLDSATGSSTVPRSAIIDHSEDQRNYYLFITGVQAITIPKSAAAALGTNFTDYLAARPSEA